MKESSLSIANYLIELADKDKSTITPLRLMKLVYIAHGFMLALLNRSLLNPRFDTVEAWKYGPVIPSVYHSFKIYGKSPITKKTTVFIFEEDTDGDNIEIVTPELIDANARRICELVFHRYKNFSDWDLVRFLHKEQSPWGLVYKDGENNVIPDLYTKVYFKKLVDSLLENSKDEQN